MRLTAATLKVIAFIFLFSVIMVACSVRPSGGGSIQVAPDSVRLGEPVELKLTLSTWGSEIKGHYTEVIVYYRKATEKSYQSISGKLVNREKETEVYVFDLPTSASETSGQLDFYFTFKFDGITNTVMGLKPVNIIE